MSAAVDTPPATASAPPDAKKGRSTGRVIAERFGLVGVLVIMIGIFSVWLPSTFPTSTNVTLTLSSQTVILVLALAVTLPLRAGDFDLSLSMVMVGSASIIGMLTTRDHMSLLPAVLIAVACAVGIGAINALLIVGIGIDSFVATLGMMTFLGGAIDGYTGSSAIVGLPTSLHTIALSSWGPLPSMVYIGWGFAAVLWFVYEYTPFGRRLLFTGGNPSAARLAGIKVARVRSTAFISGSIVAALAGVLLAGGLGAVDPTSGGAYLLSPYAAAFLGMTVIQFRRFNVVGTVVGVYVLAVGVSGLQLLGVQSWVSDVFNGLMLVVAVTAATLLRKNWSLNALRRVAGRLGQGKRKNEGASSD